MAYIRRLLVGGMFVNRLGQRVEYSEERVLLDDGTTEKVGMTEAAISLPQVVRFTKVHDPDDWELESPSCNCPCHKPGAVMIHFQPCCEDCK